MKLFFTYCFLFLTAPIGFGQSKTVGVTGQIKNYYNQSIYIYQCYADTLLLVDSVKTDSKGNFVFSSHQVNPTNPKNPGSDILYRFNLQRHQWFYLLWDGKSQVQIQTVYLPDIFYNWAMDSMQVVKSDENKLFYRFQKLQIRKVVADKVMREMMRLFPYYDPFQKTMIKEYEQRYLAMENLFKEAIQKYPSYTATKIIKAYYTPNPAWDQPDNWRDSIIAAHYFDYFNPADPFYLQSNILPEKIDDYFSLFSFLMRVNRETRQDFEKHITRAAHQFLSHTVKNFEIHQFCLQYILKYLDREKMYDALFSVYDKWVYQAISGDCEQTNPALNKWREKVSVLRNIQIGSTAPDFVIDEHLNLHNLQSDYTLVLFWASWCPHCVEEVPKIKKVVENYLKEAKGKSLMVVAVSLDTEREQWQKFVTEKNLFSFLNFSELKGWQSEVVKKYNVYATPTMFLLDKDKKIIAKPETAEQLIYILTTESSK